MRPYLHRVDVLEFVYQEVLCLAPYQIQHFRMLLQELHSLHERLES